MSMATVQRDNSNPWQYSADMMSAWTNMWFRWMNTFMGPMTAWQPPGRMPWPWPSPPPAQPDAAPNEGLAIDLAIESAEGRPTQARLDIDDGAREQLVLDPPTTAVGLALPDRAVRFELGERGLQLEIAIGPDVLPGVYVGSLRDAWTGEAQGRLEVCVGGDDGEDTPGSSTPNRGLPGVL
jgi:hypothetical protein